jgi:hypothetical protein
VTYILFGALVASLRVHWHGHLMVYSRVVTARCRVGGYFPERDIGRDRVCVQEPTLMKREKGRKG